jgi:lantibiotic modifying enzyme
MLFEPDRHEALCDSVWDESLARVTIQSIVHDIEQARLAEDRWPVHPRDDEGDVPRTGFKGLYLGSAGVLWALWYLRREGAVELGTYPSDGIDKVYRAYLSDPDGRRIVPSYFMGEAGILLVLWRLTQSSTAADRLYTSVESNIQNPTNEELWAAPGTMVAAWHLWEATGEGRWRDLFLRNVEQLWQTWAFDEKTRCHLWTQDMLGKVVQYFGAGHGFAGNVYPLLRGASLLDAGRRETLYDRCLAMLRATARVEGDAVNWPEGTYTPRPGRTCFSMQWCHGAPGIVTGLADFPPQRSLEVEALLVGAGRAIWKAGPLTKGYGLCHGTAGNGYAFLKLYQRTGDTRWLERARSFAAHSIVQRDRMRQQYGQGRYALWTGDPGLAVYVWHCLDGTAKLPGLEVLQ